MRGPRTLSAPGKLFLAGEYAVLWGGAARVLAVGPRVHAMVVPRDDRRVDVLLAEGRISGTATPAGVRWDSEVPAAFHFVARTFDLALRLVGGEGTGFSVAFEPSPTAGSQKLGLGSSARAVVLAAEAARTALDASYDPLKLALLAHASAQGGSGSGGDVAACFAGGAIQYRRYDVTSLSRAATSGGLHAAMAVAPPVELVRLSTAPHKSVIAVRPEPVEGPSTSLGLSGSITDSQPFPLLYAFGGESASTVGLVAKVEARLSGADRARFVDRSDALGAQLDLALRKSDFGALREAFDALQQHLWRLGETRSEALERVLQLASAFGVAGKQSGAGGGDGCLLVAPDTDSAAKASEALQLRGFYVAPIAVEPGLRGEATTRPELAAWLSSLTR